MFEKGTLTVDEIPVDDYEEYEDYMGRKWLKLNYSIPFAKLKELQGGCRGSRPREICHPDQNELYCQIATPRQKAQYKVHYGRDIRYTPFQLVGVHTLGAYMKVLGGIAGFDSRTTVHNYLLCMRGITEL
eukprot:scaffold78213_cov28-Attheya_sp.AAC.1